MINSFVSHFCRHSCCERPCICPPVRLRSLVDPILEPLEKKLAVNDPFLKIPLSAILLLPACLFMAIMMPALGADQEAPAEPITTKVYKVMVDLVSVNVSVTDKSGHCITDLTKDDFQVLEEGKPQEISVFTIEATPGTVISLPKAAEGTAVTPPSVLPLSRKIILFVDDLHIQFENLARLIKAGEDFVRNSVGPNDLVALITSSGLRSVEFTKDRDSVVAVLRKIFPIAQNAYKPVYNCPPLTDYQAYFISTNPQAAARIGAIDIAIPGTIECANLYREADPVGVAQSAIIAASDRRTQRIINDTRSTLDTIHELVTQLQAIPGRKTVAFLSDGFLGIQEIPFQLQNDINAASQANTVFFTIKTTGLEVVPAGGDISDPIRINEGDEARVYSTLESEGRFRSEDPLYSLADGTGGTFLYNSNDMLAQLNTVTESTEVSYVLGFYSTNTKQDGKYRRVSVRVKRPHTVLFAQQGYFAPKWEEAFRQGKNEDIQGALQASGNLKEIPFSMSLNVTGADSTQSTVEVQTLIDVGKIRFRKRENRNKNVFNIVTVIYDDKKRFVDGRETQINFDLSDPLFKNVMEDGLKNRISFSLEPGKYTVKTIVREAEEMQLGSNTKKLKVSK
jgi:VWFA-related protein